MGDKNQIIIRRPREDDRNQIKNLVEYLLMVEKSRDISGNTKRIMRDDIDPSLRGGNHSRLFVAVRNGDICGFALAKLKSDTASVAYLVVKQKYQRFGIGKKLMEAMIEYAKAKGCKLIEALVYKDNEKSKKFHKRMDFKPFSIVYRKEL